MKQKNKSVKKEINSIQKQLLWLSTLITLYFNPQLADPFNSPKFYLLLLGTSFFIVPLIFVNKPEVLKPRRILIFEKLILFFIFSLTAATVTSDVKYNSIFGEIQRQTGVLTYMCLAALMYLMARYFSLNSMVYFYHVIMFIGLFYFIYGVLQFTNNDFFEWNNQYNSIIGTLGNPNFAAAFMSIIAVLSWSYLFLEKINLLKKLFMAIVLLGLSLNIVLSNARQGILTLLASLSIFTLVIVFKKNRFLGIAGVIVFGIVSIISIAGMLQSGPLEKLLYKDSVSLRGYYWRAGVNMFANNPLFGVGIERYGANFKFYRDSGYANTYGYDLISTNAHNVPIQFFATGGIFVGIAYLAIQLLVLSVAIKRLRSMRGDSFIFYLGILCAWIAFQFQSLVSIDNIGLTIWGWLFAGCLVGASADSHDEISTFKSRRSIKLIHLAPIKPIISGVLLAATLVFVLFLSKGESNMMEARNRYNPNIKDDSNAIKVLAQQIISDPLSQPAYKLEAANYLIQSGYEEEGLTEFEKLGKQNGIHPTFLIPLASMYEYKGRYEEAIKVREQVKIYDPHNLNNYLQLARLYKDTNDMTKALEMKLIVINQAPNSPQAKSAQEEIDF